MGIRVNRRRMMGGTSSWAVLSLMLASGATGAWAQTPVPGPESAQSTAQAGEDAPPDTDASAGELEAVVVVGSRAAQQSANERKKNARTPTDSIVADDIGSFPDRNVNEAISRIPGVALQRNDFGEGEGVAVRGNGPDLTRVELDGVGVQSTTGLALNAESARSADMRELPAELVKSVDVVKGSTADMTEGSLGGSILIKTRTGLDFKKPYLSFRLGGGFNSLEREVTPDGNIVASRKFFDNRLGVILSGTYQNIHTDGHTVENTTSNNRGFDRLYDFDQSPNKTFVFNPATVGTDAANVVFPNSTETPLTLVTKSASAQTKADCFRLFPHNPTGNNAQKSQRILEQQSCLNQWNDYTPSLVRQFMNSQDDIRTSVDVRFDYRLTDDITLYAKFNQSNRLTEGAQRARNLASGLIQRNPLGSFVDTTSGYPRQRTAIRPGFFLFDPMFGLNQVNQGNNTVAVLGNVINVVPSSVVVDANHNVTKLTLTNNSSNIDQIANINDTKTHYAQVGGNYSGERLQIEFLAGATEASSTRDDRRTSRNYFYGDATLTLQPNGFYGFELPANYDDTNIDNFVQLTAPLVPQAAVAASINGPATPAFSIAQLPLTTPNFQVTFTPAIGESSEKLAKLDLSYDTTDILPFITRAKTGLMYRNQEIARWGNGGYEVRSAVGVFGQPGYVPPIVVPTAIVRGQLRACQPTPGSQGPGGLSCNYGFVPFTNLANVRSGIDTLTPEELRTLLARSIEPIDQQFFGGYPDRGNLPGSWQGINVNELFSALGGNQFINFDCVKQCTANDGKVYDQPVQRTSETITNAYFMVDFEQDLPYGLEFNGNVGVRGVQTQVEGTGIIQLNAIRVTPSFDPLNPNAAAGITTQTFRNNVTFGAETTDWLPSYNLNLWGFDNTLVLRYYGGKTVARPNVTRLLPAGNCTIDERNAPGFDDDGDDTNGCGGRVGNPGLKPFTATNSSLNLEWYPNRDTTFSLAYHRLNVTIGQPISVTKTDKLFANSDQVDPISGQPVADIDFLFPTFENGPGFVRTGFEFSARTAFTFLPSLLRYTGADFNISTLASAENLSIFDPISGEAQRPAGESDYFTNLSVFYDDGRLNARLSYQKRTSSFTCITPCGGNTTDINYPGEGYTNVRLVGPGYNPGVARFNDEASFLDGKASYNIRPWFQVYVEGRNILKAGQTVSTGPYLPYADGTPRLLKLSYGGYRVQTGVVFKFQ